jgi:hypothetical protein
VIDAQVLVAPGNRHSEEKTGMEIENENINSER